MPKAIKFYKLIRENVISLAIDYFHSLVYTESPENRYVSCSSAIQSITSISNLPFLPPSPLPLQEKKSYITRNNNHMY